MDDGPADPITALWREMYRDGKPSLAWCVRWSAGGRDPLHEAWLHSGATEGMCAVLAMAYGRESTAWQMAHAAVQEWTARRSRSRLPHAAAALRRQVMEPPTLAEFLAAWARCDDP